ncbi:DUF1203 domain-containing protein [Roseibium sp.]|uniref:DUF1203 domain-containing protein n=1 Tax=Roseibium sp. TaxID=1936156 RepID=UPI003A97ADEC
MTFQVHPLPQAHFEGLSELSEEELGARNIKTYIAEEKPGYPCRVSLADADVGQTVFLLNFEHQPNDTPYRASHAIFVTSGARSRTPAPDTLPESISSRLLSVRAFDGEHTMVDAEVVEGRDAIPVIEQMLANQDVDYLQLHYARRGCFAAEIRRS